MAGHGKLFLGLGAFFVEAILGLSSYVTPLFCAPSAYYIELRFRLIILNLLFLDYMEFNFGPARPKLAVKNENIISQVRRLARTMHIAKRTKEAYVGWITRFLVHYRDKKGEWIHPLKLGSAEVNNFLTYLAVDRHVAAGILECVQPIPKKTIQQMLGHPDVSTTMIYSHVSRLGASGIESPPDLI